ncbi:calcium-binding protein [Sulfitobacter sp. F26169L]|uniref:calcium-binding protein n=1 Tax=Sulfitobacter sp. F26169L TaxID=2996015 RepID=UPI002260C5D3|nr:calcium-binding protein [Sulfitobacter sp. F26169L]MCX7568022.1 calcium-binding protein [Sulfitobacter sp. F26169L]
MARIDITPAFINFMNKATLNPLDVLNQLDLTGFDELDSVDIDQPETVTVSSNAITSTQGNVELEFRGYGFAPVSSYEAFEAAVMNNTAQGTITNLEVRQDGSPVLSAALTANSLTVSGSGRELVIEGSFPTGFREVTDLIYAVEEFMDGFIYVDAAEQADLEARIARYDLTSAALRKDGETLAEIDLGARSVEIELTQDVDITFNGTFAGGLDGGLTSLGLVASILGNGEYYTEDGITLRNMVISGENDAPFFTVSGPVVEGDFFEQARLFVDGREMSYFTMGMDVPSDAAHVETAESNSNGLGVLMAGFGGNDTLTGAENPDILVGGPGNDSLSGMAASDTIYGGDGGDVIIGGAGNDMLVGGATDQDRRDVIYGGEGNDTIDGGYGNDELRGDAGNDVIAGGFGGDTVIGGTGNDTITGSALGDMLFGSDGNDFINGGFGYDQVNGGAGADAFYHLGIADHGSDWIQDYAAMDGDTLVFGNTNATRAQFQINEAFKENAGADDVAEAFVIYRPTGQIMWALIDGMGQDEINLRIGGETFDLMA